MSKRRQPKAEPRRVFEYTTGHRNKYVRQKCTNCKREYEKKERTYRCPHCLVGVTVDKK